MPHSTAAGESEDHSRYSWVKSDDGSSSMTRQFANFERMFAMVNQVLYGQNCPYMGASISLQGRNYSSELKPFNISRLHARATKAICQTRWKYPTVAARVADFNTASYNIESSEGIESWAERTVFTICQDGGWLALRERLSRESSLPTLDGDYCLFYLIVPPEETINPELQNFDILLHTHHALIDGSGIRAVVNEFLARLADPLPDEEIVWGKETRLLLPAAVVLEKIEGLDSTAMPIERVPGLMDFHKPDVGLPIYRPDILGPEREHRGTLLVSHTFDDPNFLPQLLASSRKHSVKLTSLLHATMLKAVYESSETKPSSEEIYYSGSPMDLRNGHLIPEYCDRTRYVNLAIGLQPMKVPCHLFKTEEHNEDGLWKAAACISDQWDEIKNKKGLATMMESDAKVLLEWMVNNSNFELVTKPRTCPIFVSDPPGSQQLRGTYPISGHAGLNLVLNSYQLATDTMQTAVTTRSHSWNGLLTLCVVFNAVRNPNEKMQEFLDKWVEIVAGVGHDVNDNGEEFQLNSSSLAVSDK